MPRTHAGRTVLAASLDPGDVILFRDIEVTILSGPEPTTARFATFQVQGQRADTGATGPISFGTGGMVRLLRRGSHRAGRTRTRYMTAAQEWAADYARLHARPGTRRATVTAKGGRILAMLKPFPWEGERSGSTLKIGVAPGGRHSLEWQPDDDSFVVYHAHDAPMTGFPSGDAKAILNGFNQFHGSSRTRNTPGSPAWRRPKPAQGPVCLGSGEPSSAATEHGYLCWHCGRRFATRRQNQRIPTHRLPVGARG